MAYISTHLRVGRQARPGRDALRRLVDLALLVLGPEAGVPAGNDLSARVLDQGVVQQIVVIIVGGVVVVVDAAVGVAVC